ncbi:MAG: cation:proton antiporter [Syntrophales bacterium]
MHNLDLILTLTGGLAAALVMGYGTHRLGLSPIVGYLLAGVIVGPHTPGFTADRNLANQMAEIGVILLMFGVGLQFHFRELLKVRRVAVPGAVVQSLAATLLGFLVTREFGWDWPAGVVFGMAVSVASTVVLLRILVDNNDLHTPTGHIAVGWLVVEDLVTVLALVLLPAIFGSLRTGAEQIAISLGWSFLKIALLVSFTFGAGDYLIPWLLNRVAATHSRELFMLAVLTVALGIAVGAAELFGVSMALGAFLAGMVVGKSEFSLRAASEALPMRDAFSVLFFVSVGMLFDPRYLWEAPGLISATLGIVLLGKPAAALAIVLLLGYPLRVALSVAVALAQIGEFTFILAALGRDLGILTDSANNTLIAAAIVSISLNPLLYRLIDPLESWAKRRPRLWRRLNALGATAGAGYERTPAEADGADVPQRAVVVGYGPVGQTVVRLLRENEIEPTIVEMNLRTVRSLRAEGVPAVYGDATLRDTLQKAGVEHAVTLVLSADKIRGAREVVRLARELNPKIQVFARTTYLTEIDELTLAGADAVFSGEGEVAITMIEYILQQLGATPEQLDRERQRIRADLFGCIKGEGRCLLDGKREE